VKLSPDGRIYYIADMQSGLYDFVGLPVTGGGHVR